MSTSVQRTVSPFIAFCNANRDEIKSAHPNAQPGYVAMLLTNRWKEMNESARVSYAKPPLVDIQQTQDEPVLRRSARLRNKRLGLNFWGFKLKK